MCELLTESRMLFKCHVGPTFVSVWLLLINEMLASDAKNYDRDFFFKRFMKDTFWIQTIYFIYLTDPVVTGLKPFDTVP